MGAPTSANARDFLDVSQLHSGLLNDYMKSMALKAELYAVTKEIMRRWQDKIPKDTGNLRGTATVKMQKYVGGRPRTVRWRGDFSAGGPRAPYAPEVEAEHGTLNQVLAEMGFGIDISGGGTRPGPSVGRP